MSGAGAVPPPIAVIGMAGRFPAARDLGEFWRNLAAGRDCLTTLDDDDLLRRGERPDYLAHPGYVRRRPCMPAADEFDAHCFGMTPREAEVYDPQFRVLLEEAHSALEHGGYDPARYPGAVGVFAGTNINRYRVDHLAMNPEIQQAVGYLALEIGNAPDYVGTFVAHRLGLRGPSMTLQTACSTGLTAVHIACLSLRAGDCDMALAAVASLEMPLDHGYFHQDGGVHAPDGIPRPFDADAEGTNFGNGAGALLLKRLDDALADRDTVMAVIRGSALNNDGDRKSGFTAPSAEGQADCIAAAIRHAGIEPHDISYVEAHGTGTKVGDPIEIAGLAEGFRRAATAGRADGQCWIGSVKGNVGHVGQAAGICGLIKTVLALQYEQIPPSVGVSRVNPLLGLADTPFRVATEPVAWPRTPGRPRRAGVSSFGIGGTNAHVVIEEAPGPADRDATARDAVARDAVARDAAAGDAAAGDTELIVWSGADAAAAGELRGRLAHHFASLDQETFRDSAYTLRVGRTQRRHRGAVVARDPAEAARRLRSGEALLAPDGVERELVFCFPGQGSQHPGMAHRLYHTEPDFRSNCDEAFELAGPVVDRDLRALWRTATDTGALAETAVAQPLLFLLEYALARTLQGWGLRPARVLGHSVGELVAATVAGVFDPADGLRAVAARATLMQEMPRGGMLAVAAAAERVSGHLDGEVSLAAVNGARQCVLSGPEGALASAAARLQADGVRSRALPTSHAFHSPAMAPAAERFEALLRELPLRPPGTTLVSCATGEPVTPQQATDPSFWARQLVDPVYFDRAAATVAGGGPAFLLEVGPGRTLTALLRNHPDLRATRSVPLPTMPAPEQAEDPGTLVQTLGRLWVEGHPVDLPRRDAHSEGRRVPVPGYPYQRQRFWVERPPDHEPIRDTAGLRPDPLPATRSDDPTAGEPPPHTAADWSLGVVDWIRTRDGYPAVPDQQVDGDTAVLILPSGGDLGARVRTAFQLAGYRTVPATSGRGVAHPIGPALDIGSEPEWDALMRRAEESGPPAVVAYAGLLAAPDSVDLSTLDEQVSDGYFAVLECARAVARSQRRRAGPVTLLVLTRRAADVTGAEQVNPATAMVHGLTRTVEQEYPGVRCVVVDVAPETPVEVLSGALVELADPAMPPLVALRGSATWLPVLRRVPRNGRAGRPRLRRGGVYLVTGGLGGIGLAVASALADTGLGPRIALLGRSAAPDRPRAAAVTATLSAIEDAGAEAMVVTGDVSDPAGLHDAVNEVERRFGPVNGVVHAAGVAGGGLLERRGRDEAERVFAAKVRGTLVLDACFADRPAPDFLLLFSSQASLTGMYGSADYAAANCFLNAFAGRPSRAGRWTAAVAWPGWSDVGMLAAAPVTADQLRSPSAPAPANPAGPVQRIRDPYPDPDPQTEPEPHPELEPLEYRRRLDTSQDWELDEHRFAGSPVLPETSLVELVLAAARSMGLAPVETPIELRDMVFVTPVAGDALIELSVVFIPMEGAYRFRIQSRLAGSGQAWRQHATGVVATSARRPAGIDLAELRMRLAGVDLATTAVLTQRGLLAYGPRWQTLTGLWEGDGEYVAEVTLPAQFHTDLATHPAHPALLDWTWLAFRSVNGHDQQYQPFLCRQLTYFAPLPHKVVIHGRAGEPRSGERVMDADVYDALSGAMLVSIKAHTLRALEPDEFASRLSAEPGPTTQVPAPEPPPVPTAGVAEDPALLSPSDGKTAFLEVLDGAYPPLVWVVPPGPRAQVRGMSWMDDDRPPTTAPAAVARQPASDPTEQPPPAVEAGDLTASLRALWAEAFGTDDIGLDDDFFDLGGNSLVSVQLSARIRQQLGVELSAAALFQATTIRRLAEDLNRAR